MGEFQDQQADNERGRGLFSIRAEDNSVYVNAHLGMDYRPLAVLTQGTQCASRDSNRITVPARISVRFEPRSGSSGE